MTPFPPEIAETLALQALGWLVAEEEILPVFLGSSGASIDDLRAGAGDPMVLISILDFILMDDAWVQDCAQSLNRPPEDLMRARAGLSGGEQVHWT